MTVPNLKMTIPNLKIKCPNDNSYLLKNILKVFDNFNSWFWLQEGKGRQQQDNIYGMYLETTRRSYATRCLKMLTHTALLDISEE